MAIRPDNPRRRIKIKLCMVGGLRCVVIHVKCDSNRLRGYGAVGSKMALSYYFGQRLIQQLVLPYKPWCKFCERLKLQNFILVDFKQFRLRYSTHTNVGLSVSAVLLLVKVLFTRVTADFSWAWQSYVDIHCYVAMFNQIIPLNFCFYFAYHWSKQ